MCTCELEKHRRRKRDKGWTVGKEIICPLHDISENEKKTAGSGGTKRCNILNGSRY